MEALAKASSEGASSGSAGTGVGPGLQRDTVSWTRILDTLTQHKSAWPFSQPVDPEGDGVPDYYDIVKTPMDLITVQERISRYPTHEEFVRDVNLIWQNCYLYNGKDHPISKHAQTLERVFNTWVKNQEARRKAGNDTKSGYKSQTRLRRTPEQRLMEKIYRKWISAGVDFSKINVPNQIDLRNLESCLTVLPHQYLNGAVELILTGCPEALQEKAGEPEMNFRASHLNNMTWRALMSYISSCMCHVKAPHAYAGAPRPHAFLNLAIVESVPIEYAVLETTPFSTLVKLREIFDARGGMGGDDESDEDGISGTEEA